MNKGEVSFKALLVGKIAYYISRLWQRSLTFSVRLHPAVDPHRQYVYGFWHGKQFAPVIYMARWGEYKRAVLVSPSRDGAMLTVWLQKLGYEVVPGSSSRHAVGSLLKLVRAAKSGCSLGIAADGPRGPREVAKAGIAFLAAQADLPVIPLGVAYSKCWIFQKAWDRYQLPWPFSKVVLYLGEPIQNLCRLSGDHGQQITLALAQAESQAQELLRTL